MISFTWFIRPNRRLIWPEEKGYEKKEERKKKEDASFGYAVKRASALIILTSVMRITGP
jgi:hypothetical protein